MNPRIRGLAIFVTVLYGLLFAKLNQIQVFGAADLNDRVDNSRKVARDFNRERGIISSADGTVLARSVETGREDLRFQREYPTGDLFAHVVGAFSFAFGSDGLERRYSDQLSGRTSELQFPGLSVLWDDTPNVGDLTLTIDAKVQQAAKDALGQRKGSVVAIDPRTGAIRALWSFPSYDPNLVATNDVAAARAARELMDASPDKPRLARSYRERYFPGSTFKVVTAGAGLESGKVDDTRPTYPVERSFTPPLTSRPIANFDRSACGGTLPDLLRVSCNSSFARMGSQTLGPDPMIDTAGRFGFNDIPPLDIDRGVVSVFPNDFGARVRAAEVAGDADVYENTPALAQASIGQNDVSATPLQMALVAAAVANGGSIMTPYVVDRVTDPRGRVVERANETVWKSPLSPQNAAILRADLLGVVAGGTAKGLATPGLEVGGKTGTAQLGTVPPRSHAWIIAFAGRPGGPAELAVAVIVEGQLGASEQTGGRVAAPIAKAVIEAAVPR